MAYHFSGSVYVSCEFALKPLCSQNIYLHFTSTV